VWLCVCKCDGVCAFVCFCVRHVFEGLCVRVREKMAHKAFVCGVFLFNFSLWAKIRLSCIGPEDSVMDASPYQAADTAAGFHQSTR